MLRAIIWAIEYHIEDAFMTPILKHIALLATVTALTACATDDPNQRAKVGAAVGAVAGAVIGNQAKSDRGKYVGAIAGAAALQVGAGPQPVPAML